MTLGEGSGLVAVVAPLALGGTYNLQFFLDCEHAVKGAEHIEDGAVDAEHSGVSDRNGDGIQSVAGSSPAP